MGFKDLRGFMGFLEKKGELRRVKTEVDSELEITEIVDRIVKSGGPALLFERVKGLEIPVVSNLFGSYNRMAWALGRESFGELENIISGAVPRLPKTLGEGLKSLFKLALVSRIKPKIVKNAPCQEIVLEGEEVDLSRLPVLKCWPQDAGRFITLPLVTTKDPETGHQNIGMYRMQIFDRQTTGMHWQIHHDGAQNFRKSDPNKPFEVAVALGADPATIYSATAPLPHGLDELIFSGFLRGEPVEVVKAKAVDLHVPANAEMILEGYVLHAEERLEGPFGDHTGYYSLADEYPVFHVKAITMRKNPIYPATVVGKPPMEDCYMGKATERIFLPLIKAVLPEVKDIDLPLEGVFHNCVIVSIKKGFPKHAFKTMNALWSLGQMMFSKFIVVVDEHVNVHDYSEVAWRVFNNVDPKRDCLLSKGPLDVLDHSSPTPYHGHKMGIDATRKWPEEGHSREWPDEISMDEKIRELVDERWAEYGLG
ncbi:MAG TPA: menaquinone biosynthesis decarboxylase [Actinobacteria bacterium]|nr:menaquinone biosynthesis decarboxylase [Actinomycetota bacterium]